MGKKKLKLEFKQEMESHVIGISTHLKDYRLIWFINKSIGFSFKRINDIMFSASPSKPKQAFSTFTYNNEEDHLEYYLISNTNNNNICIPSLKAANYLLIINGYLPEDANKKLITELRKIKNVLTVYEIIIDKDKKIADLISQVELHIINLQKKEKEKKKKRFDIKDLNFIKNESNLPKN